MKNPVKALLASALATMVVLSGGTFLAATAQSPGDPDATIQIGSLYEPQNLDNTAGGGQGVTEAFNGNVYEGLFRLTDDGEVEPLLAEHAEVSDDGLTYTFTLRDGRHVPLRQGAHVGRRQVQHRARSPPTTRSRLGSRRFGVDREHRDPRRLDTVVFTLSEPSISFLYNLATSGSSTRTPTRPHAKPRTAPVRTCSTSWTQRQLPVARRDGTTTGAPRRRTPRSCSTTSPTPRP